MKTKGLLWHYVIAILFLSYALPSKAQYGVANLGGVRAIGMGDAFTAVADDENALYYNPAALACLDKPHGTILLNIKANQDLQSSAVTQFLIKHHSQFRASLDGLNVEDLDYQEALQKNTGILSHAFVSTRLIETVSSNFGFSLVLNETASQEITHEHNKVGLYFNHLSQATAILGYGRALNHNEHSYWYYGLDVRYTVNEYYPKRRLINNGDDFYRTFKRPDAKFIFRDMEMTQSLNIDLGLLYELKKFGIRSGFVIRNFFVMSDESIVPKNYNFGLAFIPSKIIDLGTIRTLILSFDYSNFADKSLGMDNKLKFGVEAGIPIISLRTGFCYGNWLYGARLNLGFIHLDGAYAISYRIPWTHIQLRNMYFVEVRIGW